MFSAVAPIGLGLWSGSAPGVLPDFVEVLPTFEEFVTGLLSDDDLSAEISDIFASGYWNCTLEFAHRVDLELGDTSKTLVATPTFDQEGTPMLWDSPSSDYFLDSPDLFKAPGATDIFCDTPCPVRNPVYISEIDSFVSSTDHCEMLTALALSSGCEELDHFNSEADLKDEVNLVRSNAIRRCNPLVKKAKLARRNAIRLPRRCDERPVTLVRRNAIKRANRV